MAGLGVSVVVGGLTGAVDAFLTLVHSPDPALGAYRLGYVLGPLLLAVACAIPIGMAAAWIARRCGVAAPAGDTAAAGAVLSWWAVMVFVDAWRADQSAAALAALAAFLALQAAALARLGLAATRTLSSFAPAGRRLAWGGATLALLVPMAAITPTSLQNFHAGTGSCPSPASARPTGPNILLVTVDALRVDTARKMRAYGRLAAAGIEYTHHITLSPWTLPSVASILTGLSPERHGAGRGLSAWSLIAKSPVSASAPTLAGMLGARGYRTHAIVTNPFLTARYGIDRGFCSFENVSMESEAARGLAQTTLMRLIRAVLPRALPSDRADVVRDRAERWLAERDGRPFFLWLHFLDPHAPYGDRDGASTSLTLDLMALQERRGPEVPFRAVGLLRAGEYRPAAPERERIVALYREDVAYVDRQLGLLLDTLAARGLADRTAIIFTADHGEEFWEHGGVEHGRTLYDEVVRVPFVVLPPGGRNSGEIRAEMTSVVDVAPTILGLAGLEPSGGEGVDLVRRAPPANRQLVLGEVLFGEALSGVRTATHKYVRAENGDERLFDLTRDPGERVDYGLTSPDVLAAARTVLQAQDERAPAE